MHEVDEGKHLVEAKGKVLVTSGYADYGQNLRTSGSTFVQTITCDIYSVTAPQYDKKCVNFVQGLDISQIYQGEPKKNKQQSRTV